MNIKLIIYYTMVVVQVILSLTSYIPQIIKLIQTKKSEDISLAMWFVSFADFGTYQILLLTGDAGFVLNAINALQLVEIFVVICLVQRYRRPSLIPDK